MCYAAVKSASSCMRVHPNSGRGTDGWVCAFGNVSGLGEVVGGGNAADARKGCSGRLPGGNDDEARAAAARCDCSESPQHLINNSSFNIITIICCVGVAGRRLISRRPACTYLTIRMIHVVTKRRGSPGATEGSDSPGEAKRLSEGPASMSWR